MWRYYELLSFARSLGDLKRMREAVAAGRNPRDYKMELAAELHGSLPRRGGRAGGDRPPERVVQGGGVPRRTFRSGTFRSPTRGIRIGALLKPDRTMPSTSEALRKLGERGTVRVDGTVTEDRELALQVGGEHLLQLGKRGFARVRLIAE